MFGLSLAGPAAAQDAGACYQTEQSLREAQRARNEAEASRSRSEQARAECGEDLARTKDKLATSSQAEASCQSDKQAQCTQMGAFVEKLANGQSPSGPPNACVAPEQVLRVAEQYRGMAATSSALAQLGAYAAGESDTLPAFGSSTPQAERILSRVLSNRGGLRVYRRLLVEAVQRLVPATWSRLKAGGAPALESWFNSAEPLDAAFVEEAKKERTSGDRSDPVLSTTLRLVQAYELLARCNDPAFTVKSCARARQLRQLLESTGPLTVARRTEEIWGTECSAIGPPVVAGWLVDFPTAANSKVATELLDALYYKLYACWLTTSAKSETFPRWMSRRIPVASDLPQRSLQRRKELEELWREGSAQDVCGRAALAINGMPAPEACVMPPDVVQAADAWATTRATLGPEDRERLDVRLCDQYVSQLWDGHSVTIPASFERAPIFEELVQETEHRLPTSVATLRAQCQSRRGPEDVFAAQVVELGHLGKKFGDAVDAAPWRLTADQSEPQESARFREAERPVVWLGSMLTGKTACERLGLETARCNECRTLTEGTTAAAAFDCTLQDRLDRRWARYRILSIVSVLSLALTLAALVHGARIRRARRRFGAWSQQTTTHLEALGLTATKSPWRWVFPGQEAMLRLALPATGGWERHGKHAVVVHALGATAVTEADVNRAAGMADSEQASLAILTHEPGASPDLGAIRASLDWAARGGHKAVQVLPLSTERLHWSSRAVDLLDVVDDSSLRGNPFEVRGRITSSAQFFNRERLVSALLASVQAGKWTIVTGLRRFGKSSLTLEVARRLPGPAAYVDLTGFYHELSEGTLSASGEFRVPGHGASSVDVVLRQLCQNLLDASKTRYPSLDNVTLPADDTVLDGAHLSVFFRSLSRAIEEATGQPAPPLLLVLDEIEQALGVPHLGASARAAGLAKSVEAFGVLLGRLKSAVVDASAANRQAPVGILLGCAVHPILWAPLPTLAQQSIMGTFQSVCVPNLPLDAAEQMMKSLGAWHGVRFDQAALTKLLEASQRIPLLLRRLGSSVLELYDIERAHQGGLGAVNVGEVGADEAIAREERVGSPVRVWVESEIAPAGTPVGAVLRHLATKDSGEEKLTELARIARGEILQTFRDAGFESTLSAEELSRRADEAAHVTLRLLGESGLVEPLGDLTSPDGYRLPDGIVRRTLARGVRESQSAPVLRS